MLLFYFTNKKHTNTGQTVLAKKLETSKTTRELEILTALQDNAHIAHLVIRDVVDGHVVFENAANTLERLLKSRNEPLDEAVGFRSEFIYSSIDKITNLMK